MVYSPSKDCIFALTSCTQRYIMAANIDPNTGKPVEIILTPNPDEGKAVDKDKELVEKLVNDRLEESLKPIKEKLDKAFSARDKALEKVKEFEEKEKAANLKRLEEEGRYKEAADLQLAEERAKSKVLEQRNVELTRDNEVRQLLSALDLKNENATEMARREIVDQLIRNDQGTWVHRSGISVKEFVKAFAVDDDHSFLFKVKASSGSGGSGPSGKPDISDGNKSLFSRPQSEVLKLAAEGKLPKRK
jgi:hypothetical protein